MGCFQSKEPAAVSEGAYGKEAPTKAFHKPKWKADTALTPAQLQRMRDEFWDTQPHYGGAKEIWDALKAAAGADLDTARIIFESAGVIVARPDLTVCYDERGARYELPAYLWSEPTNLVREE